MNIGIVCYPTYGGSGIAATELGKNLARRGHRVHLISYAQPIRMFEMCENVIFHKVEVNAYPLFRYPPYSLEITATIVDVAREEGLDVVHAHYAIPHGMSALNARMILENDGLRLPFVITLHGTDITIVGMEPAMSRVTRYILQQADAVSSVSEYLREETNKYFCMNCAIDVIPNFIDPEVFHPQHNSSLRQRLAKEDEKILVHASNFRPVKNIPHIIEMFANLHQQVPARLVLIGDGPERSAAEHLCKTLGIRDHVVFPGMRSNIVEFLSVADLYIMASQTESFGLSALEAMACGLPVVAYRVGGVPEVVAEGVTGLLVSKDDIAELGRAAARLLQDDELRASYSVAARQRASKVFSHERVVSQYERLYRRVIDQSSF
ncbi:MAG: N-acetyl-alpha-D-glucosaminyl L-malate synthase BshA [Acidobacteria bacterium]|nr:N-acetyl-alpha-D-glucosaminyl L-malate synthase BshA [Acidobacteriota bacterium]